MRAKRGKKNDTLEVKGENESRGEKKNNDPAKNIGGKQQWMVKIKKIVHKQ